MPLILVTNDDGVHSPGLAALFEAMSGLTDAVIVAPDREMSATSHSLTMHRPLMVTRVNGNIHTVNGTPTDCVAIAVSKVLEATPDLLVSGINLGGNLGDDITYSGTVSAAIEGTILGIPSFAISMPSARNYHFATASHFARRLARRILEEGLPKDTLLNVNVPNLSEDAIKGVRFSRQGKKTYLNSIQETFDPMGRKHYWIGGGTASWEEGRDTDNYFVEAGYISITPLHLDLTNYDALGYLQNKWEDLL